MLEFEPGLIAIYVVKQGSPDQVDSDVWNKKHSVTLAFHSHLIKNLSWTGSKTNRIIFLLPQNSLTLTLHLILNLVRPLSQIGKTKNAGLTLQSLEQWKSFFISNLP